MVSVALNTRFKVECENGTGSPHKPRASTKRSSHKVLALAAELWIKKSVRFHLLTICYNIHRDYIKVNGDLFTSCIAHLVRRQLVRLCWQLHRTAPCYVVAPRLLSKLFVQHGVKVETTPGYLTLTHYFRKAMFKAVCSPGTSKTYSFFSDVLQYVSSILIIFLLIYLTTIGGRPKAEMCFYLLNFLQSDRRCDSAQRLRLSHPICIWSLLVACEETLEMLDWPFIKTRTTIRPLTSLGHKVGRRVFWEGPNFWTMSNSFKLCPTHFPGGRKIFQGGFTPCAPSGYWPDDDLIA